MHVSATTAVRDTIAAIATAAGAAGVGIVRLSGPRARAIAEALTGATLRPRHAHHVRFLDADGAALDDGLALWFQAPRSYTGEDVVELQAHGSPVLLAQLLRRCLALGARAARPGEFTERAFLEGRLDLAQAEAVADLIHAGSEAAARAARRALDGEFSRAVEALAERFVALRMQVEAGFDFPDEDIDLPADAALLRALADTQAALAALRAAAARGRRLVDGLHVVIVGAPNVGKSSLLNALAAEERAIVDARAGTTRDLLRETITLDGIVVTLVDTAGLHAASDPVEREGMRRARAELARADLVLAVLDAARGELAAQRPALAAELPAIEVLWLHNKSDCTPAALSERARAEESVAARADTLVVSARTGAGLDALRGRLRAAAGAEGPAGAGTFSARERHLEALDRAAAHLAAARQRLDAGAAELAAEDLRLAHAALGEITGLVDADQLLGRIFAGFCIGK
jgi:tRNA modification GTPase